MKLRSDFQEALTNMHRLHRESSIPHYEYQRWHSWSSSSSGSGMNTGGAHHYESQLPLSSWNERIKEQGDLFWTLTHQDTQNGIWTIFFFKNGCSLIVYS